MSRATAQRVIVCGSRHLYGHDQRMLIADTLADLPGTATVVHGGAKGADRIAHQEAQKLGLLVEEHPYQPFIGPTVAPKRAPLVRNEHMAKLGADLCIAFWDGMSSGTRHMIDQAEKHGIPVEKVSVKVPL